MQIRNLPSFSASRYGVIIGDEACARKAYYGWYLMWNGWWYKNRAPNPRNERPYKAKFFNTEAQWAGSIIHQQIELVLKQARSSRAYLSRWGGVNGVKTAMLESASRSIDNGLRQARRTGPYPPKETVRLLPIELGFEADEKFIRDRVSSRIEALFADEWPGPFSVPTNLFVRTLHHSDRIISVEDLLSFRHGGIDVFMKMDLQTRSSVSEDECFIIDWKTGNPREKDAEQLAGYSVWARSKGWKSVKMLLVYLGESTAKVVNVELLEHECDKLFTDTVHEFVEFIRDRVVDGDLDRNEPIEEKWEPTTNPATCKSCQFQLICAQDGTKPSGD